MIDLAGLYPDLESIIDFKLEKLSQASTSEIGPLCEELCIFYRTTGIAALLLELDTDRFYHMLIRSGLTRLFLLQRTMPEDKDESRFCKVTRSNGFFDSVAANRFDVAEKIAILSPQKWMEKYEYEDDYCYVLFLHEIIKGGDKNLLESILDRFKAVLGEEQSPKYDICCALLKRDAEFFDDVFSNLLDQWTKEIDFQERSINRNEVEFATARHIYIEGLSLLRIAGTIDIKTREEYEYCPKETRTPMHAPFPDVGYPK